MDNIANSPLVSQITYRLNGTTRMTATKQYDYLNHLTSISSAPTASSLTPIAFNYTYNPANQRTNVNLADGSYWVYPIGNVNGFIHVFIMYIFFHLSRINNYII